MYGVIDFYRAAKEVGIKPIIGCEIYVAPGSRFDHENVKGENRYYHMVLLAKNNQGYHNLMKIVSRGFTEGFYYKPRVDYEILEQFHEGIIALSACLAGEIPTLIRKDQYEEAKAVALKYRNLFGKDSFYLELQDHGIPEQTQVNNSLLRMAKETGIPLVATNDIHYIYDSDAQAHDILLCIQTGKKNWQMKTGCATKADSITVNPRKRCAGFFRMPRRHWTTPTRLPRCAMWRSCLENRRCQNSMCRTMGMPLNI
jgi:DNA polymerase-3 subunit alpha